MIDPVETVVTFLRSTSLNTTLAGRIVGGRARYGQGWTLGQTGLTVRPSGGNPEIELPVRNVRLEMRCWGATDTDAWDVYLALTTAAVRTNRTKVALSDGTQALLHVLQEASGASLIWDDEIQAWSVVVYYGAIVGENATT